MPESRDPAVMQDLESELVEGCRSGSTPAFEKLYALQGARMKSVAFNILRNTHDAEDAVQNAFLNIYRNARGFRGKSAFSTWTFRILINTCRDLMRTRTRCNPEVAYELADTATGRIEPVPRTDHPLRLALESSLQKLSERRRVVFLLFEVEGFRHREIAEILRIPEGTSKTLLFEAKRELQRLLWDHAAQPERCGYES